MKYTIMLSTRVKACSGMVFIIVLEPSISEGILVLIGLKVRYCMVKGVADRSNLDSKY